MSVSLSEFERLVSESFKVKEEIEAIQERSLKPLEQRLRELDRTIIQALQDNNMKTFKTAAGAVTHVRRSSVSVPKTMEDKEALFSWLREKGDDWYYSYVTVNSQSINSLYKQEFEKAKEEGNFDFTLPGVGEPTFSDTVSRRRGK